MHKFCQGSILLTRKNSYLHFVNLGVAYTLHLNFLKTIVPFSGHCNSALAFG